MADVKWIRLNTDMFDNAKIKYLRTLPEGNNIVLIWVMLLSKAGKCNSNGYIFLTESIPYTPEMLSAEFGFDLNTIKLALASLNNLNMIQLEEHSILIPGWNEHQNSDGLDKIREQTRKRVAKFREKQKQLTTGNEKSNVTVALSNETEIERELEEEIDIYNISKDILCSTYVQRLIKKWNSIGLSSTLKTINAGTNRYKMLKARIRQYSEEEIINAIDEVPKSDFLMGRIKEFEITFDWFIKPNNFTKVLEGNYRNKGGKANVQGANGVQSIEQDSGSIADKFKERQHRLTDEERRRAEEELD
ncbi:MAG: phage replisome organizer N-terminal domain-containing protein [Clostridium chrysemydis]|uniref:phage replisome organizer N-terminal domain-containing protein n=1 Tax=Clostridium chrysemydis TaxID=2665504 RepID=UPI003F3B38BE